jgi:hypothetical protein
MECPSFLPFVHNFTHASSFISQTDELVIPSKLPGLVKGNNEVGVVFVARDQKVLTVPS